MQHCREIVRGRVENGWLSSRAVSFVFIYLDLMRNHPFSTVPVAISRQRCIDNQNILTQITIYIGYKRKQQLFAILYTS